MDTKTWWTSRTIWSGVITSVCGVLAIFGHAVDQQTQDVTIQAVTNIADGLTVIGGIASAYYRAKATTTIGKPPSA